MRAEGGPELIAQAAARDLRSVIRIRVRSYIMMIRERKAWELDTWLSHCFASVIGGFETFAAGLRQDHDAVRAALTEPWSNGQAEGQINRLKTIKRQMYGRVGFDLLWKRILYAP